MIEQRTGEDVFVILHHDDVRLVAVGRLEQVRPGFWRLRQAVSPIGDAQCAPEVGNSMRAAAVAPTLWNVLEIGQRLLIDPIKQPALAEPRGADPLGQGDVDQMVGFGQDFVAFVTAVEVHLFDLHAGFGFPAFDYRFAEIFLPIEQVQGLGRLRVGRRKQHAGQGQQGGRGSE